MNFLLKVRADSSSIYDASEYGNIFYTDYKVYTRLDNPFNNNTYCIDTTQGDAWGFPRIGGSNLKFRRNFSKFSVLTWIKGAFSFGFGIPSGSPHVPFFLTANTSSNVCGYVKQIWGGADSGRTISCSYNSGKWNYMEFQYNKGIITYYCNGKKVGTINTTDVYTSIDITNTSIQLWLQNWFYTNNLGSNKRRGYIYDLVVLDDIIHTENYTLPVTYLDKFFYGIVEKDDNGYGILKI